MRACLLVLLLAITTLAQTPQQKNISVILFRFQDQTAAPMSVAEARQEVFTNSDSPVPYFNEVSFGQLTLGSVLRPDGDVFGPYTLPFNMTDCNQAVLQQAAQQAAAGDGYLSANYAITIYTGFSPIGSCGGVTGTGPRVWYPSTSLNSITLIHELGHCFGRMHADSLRCTDAQGQPVALSDTCTIGGTGFPFTVMGNGQGHFSMFEKSFIGGFHQLTSWLQPANVLTVTQTGTYSIVPLEQASTEVMGLRVSRSLGNDIWLDYRQPFGFDWSPYITAFPGPSTYLATSGNETRYIDNAPETFDSLDGALTVGKSLVDVKYGITITTLAASSTQATVRVTYNPATCVPQSPQLRITPTSVTAAPGAPVTLNLTLGNLNITACPAATYTVTAKVPSQWSIDVPSFTVTLQSGEFIERTFTVTSKPNTRAGSYTVIQKAVDASDRKLIESYPVTVTIN